MTRPERILRRLNPYVELLADERRRSVALRAKVAERDETIRALRLDLAVQHARTKVANEQRDRARDLVGALLGEVQAFSERDLAFLDEHGVGAE